MKVAILDNTCNCGYVLMRYLCDRGIDASLLLLHEVPGHGDPVNDSYDLDRGDRIVATGWGDPGLSKFSAKRWRDLLEPYEFIIGSDYAPAICHLAGRQLDVFVPHGTDVFNYPFMPFGLSARRLGEWVLARWQRRGICERTSYFWFELTNEDQEEYIRRFGNAGFQRVSRTLPQVYHAQYDSGSMRRYAAENEHVAQVKTAQEEGNVVLFHHCQQQWKNPYHDLFNKGNDRLIRGLQLYLERAPGSKVRLFMVERGPDVGESKALIRELGLEPMVRWLPMMPRKDVMACLHFTDLGIGELFRSWFTYSVVSEFMVAGVPIVHNCDQEYYGQAHASVYPMYFAATAQDLADRLSQYFSDPESFKRTGQEARSWWLQNIVEDNLNYLLSLMQKGQSGQGHAWIRDGDRLDAKSPRSGAR